jgi:hypothetical protein
LASPSAPIEAAFVDRFFDFFGQRDVFDVKFRDFQTVTAKIFVDFRANRFAEFFILRAKSSAGIFISPSASENSDDGAF